MSARVGNKVYSLYQNIPVMEPSGGTQKRDKDNKLVFKRLYVSKYVDHVAVAEGIKRKQSVSACDEYILVKDTGKNGATSRTEVTIKSAGLDKWLENNSKNNVVSITTAKKDVKAKEEVKEKPAKKAVAAKKTTKTVAKPKTEKPATKAKTKVVKAKEKVEETIKPSTAEEAAKVFEEAHALADEEEATTTKAMREPAVIKTELSTKPEDDVIEAKKNADAALARKKAKNPNHERDAAFAKAGHLKNKGNWEELYKTLEPYKTFLQELHKKKPNKLWQGFKDAERHLAAKAAKETVAA